MQSFGTPLCLLIALSIQASWPHSPSADAQDLDHATAKSPTAVVANWLELHRTGHRDEATALTTGRRDHRAGLLLPGNRDIGVRAARSLGNQRVAAVVTTGTGRAGDNQQVLLFWLVRRDGVWRINKSDSYERRVVDERLRGFLEAGDVRWHVQRGQLLGDWEAGACRLPGIGTACGSRLQLGDNGRYRLEAWGPGGPSPESDEVMLGTWRLVNGQIELIHQKQLYKCRVEWITDNQLAIETPDDHDDVLRAVYDRPEVSED